MRDIPRLSWLNAKQYPSTFPDNKTKPGRAQEHAEANEDNKNPYKFEGKWYWYDEAELPSEPYETREAAEADLIKYIEWLKDPKPNGYETPQLP